MPSPPFERDVKHVGGCKKSAWANRKAANRPSRPVVHPVDLLDAPAVHHAVIAHFLAAAAAFFSRLEDHHNSAVKVPGLGEIFGGPEQHRSMPVMPTGMHGTGCFAGIGQSSLLVNGQGIHVSTQADHFAGTV